MAVFKLKSKFRPAGDQPRAIKELTDGLKKGYRHQTLLGVTGSGKTFTVANVIRDFKKPALVISHNKTLAAQLTNEFRELFPGNAVHYFVSYYDYYQPEAYMPVSDTYIGKEAMINEEIDKLRHAATTALLTRRDVIVVASVSCIYGLGAPEEYARGILHIKVGDKVSRAEFAKKLVELHYVRTNADLKRGSFRLRGEEWSIMPPDRELIYLLEVKNDVVERIYEIQPAQGFVPGKTPMVNELILSPTKHFLTPKEERERAIKAILTELKERLKLFEKQGKYLEAERLERRTKNDLAMLREIGYCHGVENYSRHLSGRAEGEPPSTLLDYFSNNLRREILNPKSETLNSRQYLERTGVSDYQQKSAKNRRESALLENSNFLTIIDESHVTVPQIKGMYEGDASRKRTLIEYGFRLPSAADNRPLKFDEFSERVGQVIYMSATPSDYERKKSRQIVEQVVRPTGLVDPKVVIRPARGQVEDLIPRILERVERKERVLVTTLTKKMAEDLSEYLRERGTTRTGRGLKQTGNKTTQINADNFKVAYLHSDVKTLERIRILTNLRKGNFDVLVGVNLLREGLDLPEVSLVAILDADKEGFLRSETSLIQTIGRAARNIRGEVLIYADRITGSVRRAVDETERRRKIQLAYNKRRGIKPKTIIKDIRDILPVEDIVELELKAAPKTKSEREALIKEKEREMKLAAEELNFELAAILRDEVKVLRGKKK